MISWKITGSQGRSAGGSGARAQRICRSTARAGLAGQGSPGPREHEGDLRNAITGKQGRQHLWEGNSLPAYSVHNPRLISASWRAPTLFCSIKSPCCTPSPLGIKPILKESVKRGVRPQRGLRLDGERPMPAPRALGAGTKQENQRWESANIIPRHKTQRDRTCLRSRGDAGSGPVPLTAPRTSSQPALSSRAGGIQIPGEALGRLPAGLMPTAFNWGRKLPGGATLLPLPWHPPRCVAGGGVKAPPQSPQPQ